MSLLTKQGHIQLRQPIRDPQKLSAKQNTPVIDAFQNLQLDLVQKSNFKFISTEVKSQCIENSGQMKHQKWTPLQETTLYNLHNEMGNKWIQIAKVLNRSDNSVKNYFHSRMKKALRIINQLASKLQDEFKPLNYNIISKIIQDAQQIYFGANREEIPQSVNSYSRPFPQLDLKNRMLKYLKSQEKKLTKEQQLQVNQLIYDLNHFSQVFRRKKKNKNGCLQEYKKKITYKGKQILNLITENQKKQEIAKNQSQKIMLAKQQSLLGQKNKKQMLQLSQERLNLENSPYPLIYYSNFSQNYFNNYLSSSVIYFSDSLNANELNVVSSLPLRQGPLIFQNTISLYNHLEHFRSGSSPTMEIYPINYT